jgi:hypothetical protein
MVDTARYPRHKLSLKQMVSGFPTAGGFPGYLRKGLKNMTEYMTNDEKTVFFIFLENGRDLGVKTYTIPKRKP